MQHQCVSGFTMVELLVTLAVAAISLAIGVPSLVQFINKNQLSAASTELVTTLQDARERAVSRNAGVTLQQSPKTLTCSFVENGATSPCDGMDLSATDVSISAGSGSGSAVTFSSSGLTGTDLRWVMAHADVPTHQYEVRILNSGRVTLKKIDL